MGNFLDRETEAYVYTLIDPRDNAVRYVGWTVNPDKRLYDHIYSARKGKSQYVYNWIRQLLAEGLEPSIEIVEIVDESTWADAERKWIAHYRAADARLTNLTEGGEGVLGLVWTDEQRNRVKGHAGAMLGRKHTEESIAKMRLVQSGKVISAEQRAKISETKKATGISEEQREVCREWGFSRKGIPHSPEHCAKISAAKMGVPQGPHSEETKAKMSASHQARLARLRAEQEVVAA